MTTAPLPPRPGVLPAAVPVAVAIGIFGIVYGAAASPVLGPEMAVLSSALVFSGAAQFTMVALVAAGTASGGVLVAVAMLALRHLPLGAVLQPRLSAGRARRALLSWFLIDETTGLVLAHGSRPERTLVVSGGLAYVAFLLGTTAGVAGGAVPAAEPLAAALFPVLFVGLAALTASRRPDRVRAVLGGAASLALLVVWPAAGAVGVIVVAVAVAAAVPGS